MMLAPGNGAVGEDELLEEIEVMAAERVAHVDGSAADGPRSRVEFGAGVVGLEHVPIRLHELAHPQAVVRVIDHVRSLQPVDPHGISMRILKPEIVTYQEDQRSNR